MKDFFKFMFASMLGFFLTSIIVFFLFFAFIMAIVSMSQDDEVEVNDNSILKLELNYTISDRGVLDPFSNFQSFDSFEPKAGLDEIVASINKAVNDNRIRGIYLDLSTCPSRLATLEEIRNALEEFKSSGKFIYAYGTILTQKAYYMASVADKIFLSPQGFIEFKGYAGEITFFKGTLEKLDVEVQVIRHGKFKSAVEPFILDEMSEANREQTLKFVQSMWDNTVNDIAAGRGLDPEQINLIADELSAQNPDDALRFGIVDSLVFYDEVQSVLASSLGIERIKKDNFIHIDKYKDAHIDGEYKPRSKNKIAVIFASGDIVQGEGDEDVIGSDNVSETIRKARLDDKIKAVVLRVDSPGGDGIASEVILREVALTAKVKPVVVSMGDLAASGGYYISCKADKIFAQPTTITGSIGVFGIIPNFEGLFTDKMGMTFDRVMTNKNADFVSVNKPLTEYQRLIIQKEVDRFYQVFITHVAEGRNMTTEAVDAIGQGRVWSGVDALDLGLVDELGGLNDAIVSAAELAELEDYRTIQLPKKKEPLEQIMEDLMGETKTSLIKIELGEYYEYVNYLKSISEGSGVQTRLPYIIRMN